MPPAGRRAAPRAGPGEAGEIRQSLRSPIARPHAQTTKPIAAQQRQQGRQGQGGQQRHPAQRAFGAEGAGLLLNRLQFIEQGVDRLQLSRRGRPEIAPTGCLCYRIEHGLVDFTAAVDRAAQIAADADRINLDVELCRECCRFHRVDGAGSVLTVGEQNKDARRCRSFPQPLDRQTQSVADGGIFACEAQLRLVDKTRDGAQIESERGL